MAVSPNGIRFHRQLKPQLSESRPTAVGKRLSILQNEAFLGRLFSLYSGSVVEDVVGEKVDDAQ